MNPHPPVMRPHQARRWRRSPLDVQWLTMTACSCEHLQLCGGCAVCIPSETPSTLPSHIYNHSPLSLAQTCPPQLDVHAHHCGVEPVASGLHAAVHVVVFAGCVRMTPPLPNAQSSTPAPHHHPAGSGLPPVLLPPAPNWDNATIYLVQACTQVLRTQVRRTQVAEPGMPLAQQIGRAAGPR